MSDKLVLEMLQAIRTDMAEMKTEAHEQRGRLGAMERLLAQVQTEAAEQRAETRGRFDRLLDRLEQIEHRLELRDA